MTPARLLLLASFALPVLWVDNFVLSSVWLCAVITTAAVGESGPQWTEDGVTA